jgi:hypothetical protein
LKLIQKTRIFSDVFAFSVSLSQPDTAIPFNCQEGIPDGTETLSGKK